ncbi:MAG TPA: ABC transporter permease [Steroidobacteraceae bacterium]|nr:ABC transporter permease [Steroidobacteraceae bacterium]
MTVTTQPIETASAIPSATRVSLTRILVLEAHAECMRLMRTPAFSLPVIGFPPLFYVLFGLVLAPAHASSTVGQVMLATFIAFGVMAPGLFGLGVTLAIDRDRGLLTLKRALPMPPGAYLLAKLVMAMLFAATISLVLMLLAITLGHVVLGLFEYGALLALSMLGVLPFCGLGLLVGTFVKGQAAPAVINLVYLPMSFLSGVLLPLSILPHIVAQLAPLWPAYHLVQLALAAVGRGHSATGPHLLVLAGMTGLFFGIARSRLQTHG